MDGKESEETVELPFTKLICIYLSGFFSFCFGNSKRARRDLDDLTHFLVGYSVILSPTSLTVFPALHPGSLNHKCSHCCLSYDCLHSNSFLTFPCLHFSLNSYSYVPLFLLSDENKNMWIIR